MHQKTKGKLRMPTNQQLDGFVSFEEEAKSTIAMIVLTKMGERDGRAWLARWDLENAHFSNQEELAAWLQGTLRTMGGNYFYPLLTAEQMASGDIFFPRIDASLVYSDDPRVAELQNNLMPSLVYNQWYDIAYPVGNTILQPDFYAPATEHGQTLRDNNQALDCGHYIRHVLNSVFGIELHGYARTGLLELREIDEAYAGQESALDVVNYPEGATLHEIDWSRLQVGDLLYYDMWTDNNHVFMFAGFGYDEWGNLVPYVAHSTAYTGLGNDPIGAIIEPIPAHLAFGANGRITDVAYGVLDHFSTHDPEFWPRVEQLEADGRIVDRTTLQAEAPEEAARFAAALHTQQDMHEIAYGRTNAEWLVRNINQALDAGVAFVQSGLQAMQYEPATTTLSPESLAYGMDQTQETGRPSSGYVAL
jgi:hypothetical protein